MDARVQNLAWTVTLAVMVESISNVTIQNTPVILARVANALPIIQMGLFIGYQNSDYSQFTRSACYVSGQVAAVVADSMLFYLLYYLTEVYNVSHSKRITRLAKVVLAISIMLEVVYKVFACLYFLSPLNGGTNLTYKQIFLPLKGVWGFMFWISSGIQLGLIISNLWSQRNTGTLFASLVIRASKSVFAIFIFAFVLVISGIPPISDIAQITQTVTNPAGISLKTQVCLMVLVKISDSSQKSVSKSGNDLSKVGKTSESRKSSDTFQKSPGSRMHSIDGIYEGRKKSIDILKETDILEEEIL